MESSQNQRNAGIMLKLFHRDPLRYAVLGLVAARLATTGLGRPRPGTPALLNLRLLPTRANKRTAAFAPNPATKESP